jgi:hypothetical protein
MKDPQKKAIKHLLDEQLGSVYHDSQLETRMQEARASALNQRRPWMRQRVPVLGFSVAAALFFVLTLPYLSSNSVEIPVGIQEVGHQDLELVTQLEDFEQDMAFYFWLEEYDATSG